MKSPPDHSPPPQEEPTAAPFPIFRKEAVESHAQGQRASGRTLELSQGWTPWVYRLLLLSMLVGCLLAVLASVDETARGGAVVLLPGASEVDSPTLWVVLPGWVRPYLRPGTPFRLDLEGEDQDSRELHLTEVQDRLLEPDAVAGFLGTDLPSGLVLAGPQAVARARLPELSPDGGAAAYTHGALGKVEVLVGSRPLLSYLLPQLTTVPKAGGGPAKP